MALAYLLLITKEGKESIIAEELIKNPLVDNMHSIHGEFNLIAKIKAKSMIELQEFIKELKSNTEDLERITILIAKDKTKETNI
jgi:DNA-binding Lrp family transcriptional regulator